MRMMGDSILIELDEENGKLKSGLFKPETAHDHIYRTGTVLQTGPGKWSEDGTAREPIGLSPGDGVIFIKFLATSTDTAKGLQEVIGKELAILKPNDILLVYDRANPPELSQ